MTQDESVGRLALTLHAALHEEAVRRYGEGVEQLEVPVVGNGICFTDGQFCNIIRYQINTTELVKDHDVHNNITRFTQLPLFEVFSHKSTQMFVYSTLPEWLPLFLQAVDYPKGYHPKSKTNFFSKCQLFRK